MIIFPGHNEWDFSAVKDFRITERHWVQIRCEGFNFANHPNWGNPGVSWGQNVLPPSSFGVISGTAMAMRELQFGLKYLL